MFTNKKMVRNWNPARGEKNNKWKGDLVLYSGVHNWINTHFTKTVCEVCGGIKNLEWSNRDHQYRRIREDWWVLCRKCHSNYDFGSGLRIYHRKVVDI